MAFIKDLYHDEIRDGWLVKSDVKKIWNRQLEIWAEVDRICRKHDITYWAGYGTLLGAARHGGFIPWDEDIDLCMMRPDFNRFCDVVNNELGDLFAVVYEEFSMIKIMHNQTTTLVLKKINEPNPMGLLIDIFALDIAKDDTPDGFVAFNAMKEIYCAMIDYSQITSYQQRGGYFFNDLDFLQGITSLTEQDKIKFFRLYMNNLFNQSSVVAWFIDTIQARYEKPFKKEWFCETIYLPFETVELPVPKMFNEVLTSYYGDWRTPVQDGQNRLGYACSADIPWREFLQRIDLKLFFEKH